MVSIDNGQPIVFAPYDAADVLVTPLDLDPRWEWIDVSTMGQRPGTTFIKGPCKHLEVVPVESVEGERVAQLCRTCDTQFPA
jgi:hypothetical protein